MTCSLASRDLPTTSDHTQKTRSTSGASLSIGGLYCDAVWRKDGCYLGWWYVFNCIHRWLYSATRWWINERTHKLIQFTSVNADIRSEKNIVQRAKRGIWGPHYRCLSEWRTISKRYPEKNSLKQYGNWYALDDNKVRQLWSLALVAFSRAVTIDYKAHRTNISNKSATTKLKQQLLFRNKHRTAKANLLSLF